MSCDDGSKGRHVRVSLRCLHWVNTLSCSLIEVGMNHSTKLSRGSPLPDLRNAWNHTSHLQNTVMSSRPDFPYMVLLLYNDLKVASLGAAQFGRSLGVALVSTDIHLHLTLWALIRWLTIETDQQQTQQYDRDRSIGWSWLILHQTLPQRHPNQCQWSEKQGTIHCLKEHASLFNRAMKEEKCQTAWILASRTLDVPCHQEPADLWVFHRMDAHSLDQRQRKGYCRNGT